MLEIDTTHHAPSPKALLRVDIIVSLARLYDRCEDQAKIIAVVARKGERSSPSTRKVASDFLKALRR